MAALYSAEVAVSGSGKESFNPMLNPDADPYHPQNLTTFNLGQV